MADAKQRQRAKAAKEKRLAKDARSKVCLVLSDNFRLVDISHVTIGDELVRSVAEHASVTEERVRAYMADPKDQDQRLFRGFAYFSVYPLGKK